MQTRFFFKSFEGWLIRPIHVGRTGVYQPIPKQNMYQHGPTQWPAKNPTHVSLFVKPKCTSKNEYKMHVAFMEKRCFFFFNGKKKMLAKRHFPFSHPISCRHVT